MKNIKEVMSALDKIIAEEKSNIELIDALTAQAERMLFELQIRNGGKVNVQN